MYNKPIAPNKNYVIGADIGGTNSNFGIFLEEKKKLTLVLSIHYKSQLIKSFVEIVKHLLALIKNQYGIEVYKICLAAAGVISENRDYVKLTNLPFEIHSAELFAATNLSCIYLVNDFEIIGYGIDLLEKEALVVAHAGRKRTYATRAILGAGTGLGKCFLIWSTEKKWYIPIPSEGGHADFAVANQLELELCNFIALTEKIRLPLSWEDLISGSGIKRMHAFFNQLKDDSPIHPDEIFNNRDRDAACKKTFQLYTQLYGRCAKNFALETLAFGGLYITGGIAAHNAEMFFTDFFLNEFFASHKHQELLKQIPITIITDYNVSLYGAAQFLLLEGVCG